MALVVEDGTGLANADSYLSVDAADAYHLKRGNREWGAASPDAKEAALVRASDYLDATYRFAGGVAVLGQARAWPRGALLAVPALVLQATAELAARALAGELLPDNVTTMTGTGALIEKRIGPLTYKWDKSRATTVTKGPRFPLVDALLAPLLAHTAGGVAVPLVRV